MLHGRRGSRDVLQCHMSKIADASGWDSCDVTQLFYNLQCIKIKLTSTQNCKDLKRSRFIVHYQSLEVSNTIICFMPYNS